MLHPNFVIVGVIIGAVGFFDYLLKTIKGIVKPNKVSYFLWGITPLIAFAAEIKQGVGIQSLMTFIVGFFPMSIFLASFLNKKAYWRISTLDIVCGILAVLGLALWLTTKVGNIAILFSILADALAGVPTILKSYKFPETEAAFPYLAGSITAILTIGTIDTWNFAHWGYPIYIVAMNTIIFLLVQFKVGKKLAKN